MHKSFDMTYEIDNSEVLVQVDRSRIIDINVGDTIRVNGMPGSGYCWTAQDQQLLESNPDADVLLRMERNESGPAYEPMGLLIREKP
jgi:hypothetical protein